MTVHIDDRRYVVRGRIHVPGTANFRGREVKYLNMRRAEWTADISKAEHFPFRTAYMLLSDTVEEANDEFERNAKFDMIEV